MSISPPGHKGPTPHPIPPPPREKGGASQAQPPEKSDSEGSASGLPVEDTFETQLAALDPDKAKSITTLAKKRCACVEEDDNPYGNRA
jgi:hypothetical protein